MAKTKASIHRDLENERQGSSASKEGEKLFANTPKKEAATPKGRAGESSVNAETDQFGFPSGTDIDQSGNTLGKAVSYGEIDPWTVKAWDYQDRTIEELLADKDDLDEFMELARESGIVTPIIVRKAKGAKPGDKIQYEQIAGFKRTYAAQKLGIKVPAVLRELTDSEALRLQTLENANRTDPSLWNRALGWATLNDSFGKTQREKALTVGVSESRFSTGLRLVRQMPKEVVDSLALYTFGDNALLDMLKFIQMDEDPAKIQERIDRLIEASDRFESTPKKAADIVASVKKKYLAAEEGAKKEDGPEVAKTPKGGKVYSIKHKRNGVTIDLHQIGAEFADIEEIKEMLRDHLSKKGVQFSD